MNMNTQRGVSFKPGESAPRTKAQLHEPRVAPKPFDKAAWHARKAAEAQGKLQPKQRKEAEIETCYKELARIRREEKNTENIARMMRDNRAVGL
jgi:hypothetical protein